MLSERIGADWHDFALISPDIWRKQLLDYASLGAAYKYGGACTGEELRIIDQKLDRYMARKGERRAISHLLIDRFRFDSFAPDSDEAGSNLLTRFGHRVYLFFMLTPPEALVERAWKRGLEVGRYKAVDDVLAHGIEAYTGMPAAVLHLGAARRQGRALRIPRQHRAAGRAAAHRGLRLERRVQRPRRAQAAGRAALPARRRERHRTGRAVPRSRRTRARAQHRLRRRVRAPAASRELRRPGVGARVPADRGRHARLGGRRGPACRARRSRHARRDRGDRAGRRAARAPRPARAGLPRRGARRRARAYARALGRGRSRNTREATSSSDSHPGTTARPRFAPPRGSTIASPPWTTPTSTIEPAGLRRFRGRPRSLALPPAAGDLVGRPDRRRRLDARDRAGPLQGGEHRRRLGHRRGVERARPPRASPSCSAATARASR